VAHSLTRITDTPTQGRRAGIDLTVVILSFNTRALLDECLTSVLENCASIAAEVCVVDSGSTDGSIELVRERFPTAELTVTSGFGGFSHANNLVLRRAAGRYALLLNSDTRLEGDALRRVVTYMDEHPDVGVLGVKLVKDDGTLDLACRRGFPTPSAAMYRLLGLSRLFPKSPRFGRYNLTYLDPDVTAEVDSVCGAFMLVRGTAMAQVGLLDEQFYFYGEDLDWALRFHKAGWKVVYYPEVTVLHHKGQTSRKQSERLLREFYRAMRLFYRKHYARENGRLLRTTVYTGIRLSETLARFRNGLRSPDARRVST
jgi:N-acetylglucosaminyl-diphospho-decaprenol L-rhamnosyltransferase